MINQRVRMKRRRLLARGRRPIIMVGLSVIFGVALIAGALGHFSTEDDFIVSAQTPSELTKDQRSLAVFAAKMPEMDVVVHFQSQQNFASGGFKFYPKRKAFKDYIAYTVEPETFGNHCQIFMPAGFWIAATPSIDYSGNFVDQESADTLAHELLHCAVGSWHKNPFPEDN